MKLDRTTPPLQHGIETLSLPPESFRKLSNGVTLHSLGGGGSRIVSIELIFPGGPDELSNCCLSPLYGRTLLEGTAEHSAVEVAEILDYYGVRCVPIMFDHHTGLRLDMLDNHVKPLLGIVGEVLREPAFGELEVEAAKTSEVAQLQYQRSRVSNIAAEAMVGMIAGHGHVRAKKPTEADIRAVTPAMLRVFHHRLVQGDGAHAYVGGDLSDDALLEIESFLTQVVPAGSSMTLNVKPYKAEPPQRKNIVREQAEQCAIDIGSPQIPRSHPDYHNLRLTVMGLGGYFGSRLMSNVREDKGLTYGISAMLKADRCGSYMDIAAQCSSLNVDAVIEEVIKEMRDMSINPPHGEELERLRRHAYTETLEILDTPQSILNHYLLRTTLGIPDDYFWRQQQAIAALSSDVIAATVERYFDPTQLRIAVVGNIT